MDKKIFSPLFFGLVLTLLTFEVKANKEFVWEGNVSSNWNTDNNWDENPNNDNNNVYYINDASTYNYPPVISANTAHQVHNIDLGGDLTVTGGTTTILRVIGIRNGGSLTIQNGSFNVANYNGANNNHFNIYDDGSELTINNGNLTVANDLILGREARGNTAGTAGIPKFTINAGSAICNNIIFDNVEGDCGKVSVNGGTLTVNGDIMSNGEAVNLEISGGVVNVLGDLRMDDGNDSLIMNGGTLNIQGDYINDGVSIISGGTIVFEGSTVQNISSPLGANFYNLSLDNAFGFNLTDSIIVQNQLILTDGIVQTNGNSVSLLDNATVVGAGGSSFINGPVNKVGNDAFVFPIGDSTIYKPLGISAPSNANDVYRAEYRFEDPASISDPDSREFGVNNISEMEYWVLNQTMGLSAVNVTLSWDPNSIVQQPSNLLVVKWDDPLLQWMNLGNGGVTGDANNGSITSNTAVNDFTAFTLGSSNFSNPLPVELESFSAEAADGNALLKWSTLSEVNNAYFEVQKTDDLKNIETLARINSKAEGGNSNKPLTYEFVDLDLSFGKTTYYRIKQVDHDGKYKMYDFESVYKKAKISQESSVVFNAYPNPNDGQRLFVEIENLKADEYQLGVHNIKGELIFSRSFFVEENTTYIEMEILKGRVLQPGIYIVRISSMQEKFSKKIVVE